MLTYYAEIKKDVPYTTIEINGFKIGFDKIDLSLKTDGSTGEDFNYLTDLDYFYLTLSNQKQDTLFIECENRGCSLLIGNAEYVGDDKNSVVDTFLDALQDPLEAIGYTDFEEVEDYGYGDE